MNNSKTDPARSEVEAKANTAMPGPDEITRPRRGRAERRNVLPLIADALIDRALEGSVSHVKSLIELGVYDRGALRSRRRTRKKSTAELLLERWEQEKKDR